jgi:hypothetical protein
VASVLSVVKSGANLRETVAGTYVPVTALIKTQW